MKAYQIEMIDTAIEGIIGLCFEHRESYYCFVVFSCYLPPEQSKWGRDASSFYSHLLSQVYLYTEADAIYICGDLNSGIGRLDDYINDVDDIPSRVALDGFVNHHGETLLEILRTM